MLELAKKRLVGLDIGFHSIKILVMSGRQKQQNVERLLLVPTGNTPAMSEEEREQRVSGLLQSVRKELGLKFHHVHSMIPGRAVFYRPLRIPVVTGDRLEKIVRYEAKQQIPFTVDQVLLDYHIFGGSGGELEGVLFAVRRDTIAQHVRLLGKAGLRPDVIDVSTIGLFNATRAMPREPGEVIGIVNIGATTTDIVIEHEHTLKFSRSAPVAGNDITLALQNRLERSYEECEDLKVRFGRLSSSSEPPPESLPPEWASAIDAPGLVEALDNAFERVVTEIRRSVDYYISQPDGMAVSRILVSGGTAALPGTLEFLEDRLGIPTERIDPTACSPVDLSEVITPETAHSALVVCGLAVPESLDHRVTMNFIPESIQHKKEFEQKRGYIVIQAIFLALLVGMAVMYVKKQLQFRDQVYQHVDAVNRIDDSLGKELKEVRLEQEEMRKRFERLQQIAERRGKIMENLLEIVRITPTSYVSITSINIEHDRILIKGRASDDLGVKAFMEELRISPFVREMKNVTPEGAGDSFVFEITELHEPNEKERKFYSEIRPRRLQVPNLHDFRFGSQQDPKLVAFEFNLHEPLEELWQEVATVLEVLVNSNIEYSLVRVWVYDIRQQPKILFDFPDQTEVMKVYHGEVDITEEIEKLIELKEQQRRQRRPRREA